MNGGTAPVAQFQMAGDEAGVEVGEEDVADLKAKSRSVGQVLLDIALGGDDNRGRTGLISEQIGSVERFRAPGVMESVGEELYETATFARLVDCGERKLAGIQDKIIEIRDRGYCILREHFARPMIDACRSAFWPVLLAYLKAHGHEPNRGPHRHFLPMPFEPPCFVPDFFFDNEVLSIVRGSMDDRVVADQWGCDVPLRDSDYQGVHVDYQRPLFSEAPDLSLPAYVLVVSFGLVRITPENGPIEIAPGTHRMPRKEALRAVEAA